jgi:hypothetical protein
VRFGLGRAGCSWQGSVEAIRWVLARGTFAVDYRNAFGCSAAHWSATQGDVHLCRFFARRVSESVPFPSFPRPVSVVSTAQTGFWTGAYLKL